MLRKEKTKLQACDKALLAPMLYTTMALWLLSQINQLAEAFASLSMRRGRVASLTVPAPRIGGVGRRKGDLGPNAFRLPRSARRKNVPPYFTISAALCGESGSR